LTTEASAHGGVVVDVVFAGQRDFGLKARARFLRSRWVGAVSRLAEYWIVARVEMIGWRILLMLLRSI